MHKASGFKPAKTDEGRACQRKEREALMRKLQERARSASNPLAKRYLTEYQGRIRNEIMAISRASSIGSRINQRAEIQPRPGSRFSKFDTDSGGLQQGAASAGRYSDNMLLCMVKNLNHWHGGKAQGQPRYLTEQLGTEDPRKELADREDMVQAFCNRINKTCNANITPAEYRRLHNREGNMRIHAGDVICDHLSRKYRVLKLLGSGAYGQVLSVNDSDDIPHALKVLNSKRQTNKYTEAKVLKLVEYHGGCGRRFVLTLEASFLFRSAFPCMLFAQHGRSLFQHLERHGALTMEELVTVLKQVTLAIREVHTLGYVHSDVKPENILLRHTHAELAAMGRTRANTPAPGDTLNIPPRLEVVLIDFGTAFGSSANSDGFAVKYIQSRFYRAPEVFLECRTAPRKYIYDTAIDMWSLGCLAMELFLGQPLFQARTAVGMMAGITSLLGKVPDRMMELASSSEVLIEENGRKKLKEATQGQQLYIPTRRYRVSSIHDFVKGHNVCPTVREDLVCTLERRRLFVDFVAKLLRYDPSKRLTAGQAIRHPLLNEVTPQSVIDEIGQDQLNFSFKSFRIDTFVRPRLPHTIKLAVETDRHSLDLESPKPKFARRPIHLNFEKMLWHDLKRAKKKRLRQRMVQQQQQRQAGRRTQKHEPGPQQGPTSSRVSGAHSSRSESAEQTSTTPAESVSSRGSSVYFTEGSRPESSLSNRSNQSEQVLAKGIVEQVPVSSAVAEASGEQVAAGKPGDGSSGNVAAKSHPRARLVTPQARPHTQMQAPMAGPPRGGMAQPGYAGRPHAHAHPHHAPISGHHQQRYQPQPRVAAAHQHAGYGHTPGYVGYVTPHVPGQPAAVYSHHQQQHQHQHQHKQYRQQVAYAPPQQHRYHGGQMAPGRTPSGSTSSHTGSVVLTPSGPAYVSPANPQARPVAQAGPPHMAGPPQAAMHGAAPQHVAHQQRVVYAQHQQPQQAQQPRGPQVMQYVPAQGGGYVLQPQFQHPHPVAPQQHQHQQSQQQLLYGHPQHTPNIHESATVFEEQL